MNKFPDWGTKMDGTFLARKHHTGYPWALMESSVVHDPSLPRVRDIRQLNKPPECPPSARMDTRATLPEAIGLDLQSLGAILTDGINRVLP